MGKGYKHLTWHDRLKIAKMKNEGRKQVEIAHALHVSESTISRELRRSTYESLLETHVREGNVCTLLTGTCDWDLPYGRILRDEKGGFQGVVEDRDCTPEQKAIRELNVGVYVFDSKKMFAALGQLKNNNAQKEYYLTDVPAILQREGGRVGACCACSGAELIGVNTVEQLRMVEEELTRQKNA